MASGCVHPLLSPFQQVSDSPSEIIVDVEMILAEPSKVPGLLDVLKDCMQKTGPQDLCWTSADKYGNTVLHLSAMNFDPACVAWILQQTFAVQLLETRDHKGEVPIEALQWKLENVRTQKVGGMMTLDVSNRFKGHRRDAVSCSVLLQRLEQPVTLTEWQQIQGGCTCGQCLSGFISPRILYALRTAAEVNHDLLNEALELPPELDFLGSDDWGQEYLPARVHANLKKNKSVCRGFCDMCKYIAVCLARRMVPIESNVLAIEREQCGWPPHSATFLQRGGSVESVWLVVCRDAMREDDWAGGECVSELDKEFTDLAECRNDSEFGYVSGVCGFRPISTTRKVDMMGRTLDEYGMVVDSLL